MYGSEESVQHLLLNCIESGSSQIALVVIWVQCVASSFPFPMYGSTNVLGVQVHSHYAHNCTRYLYVHLYSALNTCMDGYVQLCQTLKGNSAVILILKYMQYM